MLEECCSLWLSRFLPMGKFGPCITQVHNAQCGERGEQRAEQMFYIFLSCNKIWILFYILLYKRGNGGVERYLAWDLYSVLFCSCEGECGFLLRSKISEKLYKADATEKNKIVPLWFRIHQLNHFLLTSGFSFLICWSFYSSSFYSSWKCIVKKNIILKNFLTFLELFRRQ